MLPIVFRQMAQTAVSLPAPSLRSFIMEYAGFCISGLTPGTFVGLPSRKIDLVISLDEPINVIQMPNPSHRPAAHRALIAGLQDGPAVIRQGSTAHGMHVFLTPLGVQSILGVSSAELASLVVNFSDIWGDDASQLVAELAAATTWKKRFAILDKAFLARLNPVTPSREITWAWHQLIQAHGCLSIERLAREIGWSRRHFGHRFRETIGVTPKSAARVLRFERACWLIKSRQQPLADVAAACGYYDQAHMIHEWQALSGCSPKTWIARELPFLQDYELAGRDT